MTELEKAFPPGLEWSIPYDTTHFVRISIIEVLITLGEAMALVFIVVFLFLQNWRATVIPMLAVPVSLIGTLGAMLLFGFSINTLTLFGMVLAIGIVVDDAIVVLENVERIIATEHLSPRDATVKAMEQVTGPVIAIVFVLTAVFLPVAFLGGLVGEMFRQFALTIAVSVAISGFVALTLTPALCAALLRDEHVMEHSTFDRVQPLVRPHDGSLRGWCALPDAPHRAVARAGRRAARGDGVALSRGPELARAQRGPGLCHGASDPPGCRVARADRGRLEAAQPRAAEPSGRRRSARDVGHRRDDVHAAHEHRHHVGHAQGLERAQVQGPVRVAQWRGSSAASEPRSAMRWCSCSSRRRSKVSARPAASRPTSSRAPVATIARSKRVTQQFIAEAAKRKELANVATTFSASVPQIHMDLDREQAKLLGVKVTDVFETLQSTFGQLYVNDFNRDGRVYRVHIQSDAKFRAHPDDIRNVYVKNDASDLIPLTALVPFP